MARAFAEEIDMAAGGLAAFGGMTGAVLRRFGRRGGGVVSMTGAGLISGGGGEMDCFSGVDVEASLCEGLAVVPAPSIGFCRQAISFCDSPNLVCHSDFSFCDCASSAPAFASLSRASAMFAYV